MLLKWKRESTNTIMALSHNHYKIKPTQITIDKIERKSMEAT